MNRLTTAGRLLITLLILGLIYLGLKYVAGIDLLDKLRAGNRTEQTTTTSSDRSESNNETSPTLPSGNGDTEATATNGGEENATSASRPAFSYQAPEPVGGRLRGVVELGASGFNSFIVRVDDQNRWKLQKAEFGNSLVLENMATDLDVRAGLKQYIANMLNYGVSGRDIQFVVSSGAAKADVTQRIVKNLKALNYIVTTVTPEEEGRLGLRSVLPNDYASRAFVADIGSGNTKISWMEGGRSQSVETYGSKYFQNSTSDETVAADVRAKAEKIPADRRGTCFIIGGIPFELAKQVRQGKERYTVLNLPADYKAENAKQQAGLTIYKALVDATGCRQFVFDWDANFTIGYLLSLKK